MRRLNAYRNPAVVYRPTITQFCNCKDAGFFIIPTIDGLSANPDVPFNGEVYREYASRFSCLHLYRVHRNIAFHSGCSKS